MKRVTLIMALLGLFAFAFSSCEPTPKKPESVHKDAELAQTVAGVYTGEMPCADCEAIAYTLTLRPDFSYQSEAVYKGKSEEPITESGTYGFSEDKCIIVLEAAEPGMNFFQIMEGGLKKLDINGQPITGDLAAKYDLSRQKEGMGIMAASADQEGAVNNEMMRKLYEKGVDFYARGNEPFWSLDMDLETGIRFRTMDGDSLNTPPVKGASAMDADPPRTMYGAQVESGSISATVIKEKCADNMSGEPFSHTVEVSFKKGRDKDFTTFKGCGRWVTDYGLEGTWLLQKMGGKSIDGKKFQRGTPELTFDTDALRINAHAGCNIMNGSFSMEEKAIHFSQMASTMMACPDMSLEEEFGKLVSGRILKYERKGDQLTLTHPGGQTLVYKKKA